MTAAGATARSRTSAAPLSAPPDAATTYVPLRGRRKSASACAKRSAIASRAMFLGSARCALDFPADFTFAYRFTFVMELFTTAQP